jgi:hypothetical protein
MVERYSYDGGWAEIKNKFPNMDNATEKFAHSYYRARLHLSNGRETKAKRLFRRLDAIKGYGEFLDKNEDLLNIIDLRVGNKTKR